MRVPFIGRLVRSVLLFYLFATGLQYIADPSSLAMFSWLAHTVHGFGQVMTAPFGDPVALFGGLLIQIALPAYAAYYLYSQGEKYWSGIFFVLLGFSLLDAAVGLGLSAQTATGAAPPVDSGLVAVATSWNAFLGVVGLQGAEALLAGMVSVAGVIAWGYGLLTSAKAVWASAFPAETGRRDSDLLAH